ncbi:DNA primase [Piscinibacter terrae]|uniref:DNA primase n=1 Tax=Piscinibacter terrae TaxID=2496871 RepID=A0A3N7HN75_9BURK|nr:DNA primase [Albitalea terrae]RQP22121.1 DNA primase [Albitalea terrae]
MIPQNFIDDLLSRADIVEIVGRHVDLKKAGINHKGLCPFHGEKSPSFIVSPTRQTYHCFGCGVHGNALRFLMEHTGAGFVDAVHDLAQQVGMTVPEDTSTPEERERAQAAKQRQSTLTDVLAKAAEHYKQQLKESQRAIAYLKGRGLSGQIAARFGLGYAPEGWRSLASAFPRYDDPLLEESGLVITHEADSGNEADRKRYDRFRDRVMFPIRSVQGEVIGFGGRVLDKGEPKYLNSPETPVFSKGRELYGLFEARAALRQKGYVLVVEGYMDVVALAQLGFPNAVATLGTACTADHVQKLFRFTESVIFSFDGDAAGRRAAGRALEAALPHATDTRSIRFLFLPSEHDPDSYVREFGTEAFDQYVQQAVPLSRQLLEAAGEACDLDTAEGRARMLSNARPMWMALPDGVLKRQIHADLAQQGRMDVADLTSLWGSSQAQAGGHARQRSRESQAYDEPDRDGNGAPRPRRFTPRAAGSRVSRGTANLLDRALWLLVQRSDLLLALDGESHDLLAQQSAPYDAFFNCLERQVHDHGPMAAQALMPELRAQAADVDAVPVIERMAAFHDPDPQADLAAELAILLERLRLQAAEDELKLLFDSGSLSPDAQQRGKELMATQARLKAKIAKMNEPER